MGEFEIKLHVPRDQLAPVRAAVRRGGAKSMRLRARYFDTPDGALAAHRIGLRLRQEGKAWVQTVKSEGDSPLHRSEHNVTLDTGEEDAPRPQRHAGSRAGKALARALRGSAGAPLVEVYRTDVERLSRELRSGATAIEVALDVGTIRAGRKSVPVCEVEFELMAGSREVAVELAREWCGKYGLWLDTASKAMRGERLARGLKVPPPTGYATPSLTKKMGPHGAVRAVVGAALHQVLGNASEIARGPWDEDHVHQMRVGLRRLRTALSALAALEALAGEAEVGVLTQAFRGLGAHRDAAYVHPRQAARMTAHGAPPLRLPDARASAPDPAAIARDPALQGVLLQLLGRLFAEPPADEAGPKAVRAAIEQALEYEYRHALKAGTSFRDLPAQEQHGLRKRYKRLRYLSEAVAPLYGANKVDAFIETLRPVQDALGEYQDEQFAIAFWRARAGEDPRAWYAVGWLQARHEEGAARCARACGRFRRQARPFWR